MVLSGMFFKNGNYWSANVSQANWSSSCYFKTQPTEDHQYPNDWIQQIHVLWTAVICVILHRTNDAISGR